MPADPNRSRWAKPPGPMLLVLAAVALCLLLWAQTYPGGRFDFFMYGLAMLAVLGLVWLVRLIVHVIGPRRVSWRWVCAAPALIVGVLATQLFVDPLAVRWLLAQPAFDDASRQLLAGETGGARRTIAGYDVYAYKRDGNAYFRVANAGFLNIEGFVYAPKGIPADPNTYRHMNGRWYRFTEPW